MATFDDLFGGSTSGKRFIKFEEVGESFLLEQTADVKRPPQKNQKTGKTVWLVQVNKGDRYKPMDEGDFDADEVENCFKPEAEIHIPVRVLAKKDKQGKAVDGFEQFDTDWELTRDQKDKLKEAMMDVGLPAEPGQKYAVKLLSKSEKPYKYSVKMLEK